jgi:hypothetical protein
MIDRAIDSIERIGIYVGTLTQSIQWNKNHKQLCVAQIAILAATIKGARMI